MLGQEQHKSASTAPLRLAFTQEAHNQATVYVFDRDGAPGFYVLAADDAVGNIVLGYSDTNRFSADNMAPGMKWLLESYSASVSSLAFGTRQAAPKKAPEGLAPVVPLISTVWDQSEPFNDMCPEIDGEKCLTGCVATAMAQIMKKHQWPVSGTGSYSYSVNGMTVSSDFSSHTYDWGNMIDDYYGWVESDGGYSYEMVGTPEQNAAVAQLMFDCGVAARMDYSPSFSGAMPIIAAAGMIDYFSYDKSMQYLMRDWYSESDWIKLMHEQISRGLPVMYGGRSVEDYGHEFVLDGYDGNGYFHFNWGWGGYDDGYFTLAEAAAPGEDITFVIEQDAVVNIRPDMGSSLAPSMGIDGVLCTESAEYNATSDWVTFTVENNQGGFWSYALGTLDYKIGVMNTLDGGVAPSIYSTLQPYYGFTSMGTSSDNFPVGEYDVFLVCQSEGYDWTPLHYNMNLTSGRLHFVNDGTKITISESKGEDPVVGAESIVLNSASIDLFIGESFQLEAKVLPETTTDKTVIWASSDAAIATVDATGKVTAVAEGTATITAACGNVSATCAVTVAKRIIAADGIVLDTETLDLAVGDSYRLTATVSPDDTTDKTVTWTSSDASVVSVDSEGKVVAIAPGIATITATCGNVSATCEVAVKPLDGIWNIVDEGVAIRVEGSSLYIKASEDVRISLYDTAGTLYYNGYDHTIPVENNKIYIVVVGEKVFKVKA